MTLFAIPLLGLAYQGGALFSKPLTLPRWQYFMAVLLGTSLSLLGRNWLLFLFLQVFFLSMGLQGIRELVSKKANVSTFIKRISRVGGFAFSGFLNLTLLFVASIVVLLVIVVLWKGLMGVARISIQSNWHPGWLGITMAIHQSHYFTYAYFVPFLYVNNLGVSAIFAGILFCIGWISYSIAHFVFKGQPLIRTFSFGHVLAASSLITIFFFSGNFWIVSVAWFLSGFGGGTVFCLRKLEARITYQKPDLDLWENFGHVLGIIFALCIVAGTNKPEAVFLGSAGIAIATSMLLPVGLSFRRFSLPD